MSRSIILALIVSLTGCATAPNQAGHGIGADYTPVIDLKDTEQSTYQRDLDECRAYGKTVSPVENAAGAAVAGAVFGALLSAAVGGNRRFASINAGAAGVGAGTGALVGSLQKQQAIIARCMTGRGYRVLG